MIFIRVLLLHFHVPALIGSIFCTDSSYPYTALKFGAVRRMFRLIINHKI